MGFTITELMIVVSIIAIIASFAIPTFTHYIRKSKTVEALEMLRHIYVGETMFYHKLNEYVREDGEKKDCGSDPKFTVLAPYAAQSFAYFDTASSKGKGKPPKGQKEKLWWENLEFDPCSSYQSPDQIGATMDAPSNFVFGAQAYSGLKFENVRKNDDAEIYARGDLDGDGIFSEFMRIIYVDERDMSVYGSSGIYKSLPSE